MTDPPTPEEKLSAIVEGISWDLDDAIKQYRANYKSLQEQVGERFSEEKISELALKQVPPQIPQFQWEKKKKRKK